LGSNHYNNRYVIGRVLSKNMVIVFVVSVVLFVSYIMYVLFSYYQKENKVSERVFLKSKKRKSTLKPEEKKVVFKDSLYITPEEECDVEALNAIMKKVLKMPKVSSLVHRIYALIHDPDCSPKDVALIAQTDPILVSQILQTINSVHYSLPQKVDSVFSAILLMGYNQLYKMIVGLEMKKTFSKVTVNPKWKKELWEHSFIVSTICGHLAKKHGVVGEGTASTAGLLHDIGKIYLCPMIEAEEHFNLLYASPSVAGKESLKNESGYFGITHAVVGACLMKYWGFSSTLKQVAAYHHFPLEVPPSQFDPESVKVIGLVCIADIAAKAYQYDNPDILKDVSLEKEYFNMLNISGDISSILEDVDLIPKLEESKNMVKSMS